MTGVAQLEHAEKRYDAHGGFALEPTSLLIEGGSWTVITGRSGAGKTTLLLLLAGLARLDRGRQWLFGREITGDSESARARLRRERLGMIYQQRAFLEHLPVWENVACRLIATGVGRRERRALAERVLTDLGLEMHRDRAPRQLSGGEQQRVAFARAVVAAPDLLIADEPTAHVDAETARVLLDHLKRLRARGTAVVIATHDPLLTGPADVTLTMQQGRLSTS